MAKETTETERIRMKNFQRLYREFMRDHPDADKKDFAEWVGLSAQMAGHYTREARTIGKFNARKIEAARGLPPKWLDKPQPDDMKQPVDKPWGTIKRFYDSLPPEGKQEVADSVSYIFATYFYKGLAQKPENIEDGE